VLPLLLLLLSNPFFFSRTHVKVIELALGTLKGSVAANLKLELYGREFTVFASDLTRDLALHRQKEQMAAADAKNSKDQKGNEGSASSSSTAALPPVSARPTLAAMLAVRPERADATLTQVLQCHGYPFFWGLAYDAARKKVLL